VVDLLPNRVDSARTELKKPGFDAAFFRLDITMNNNSGLPERAA
jgi:hypothetical protein